MADLDRLMRKLEEIQAEASQTAIPDKCASSVLPDSSVSRFSIRFT